MNFMIRTFLIFVVLLKYCECFEFFDESAWSDNREKDNFFDYKELKDATEEVKDEIKNFSNNIDFELFRQSTSLPDSLKYGDNDHTKVIHHHYGENRHFSPNVLDFFLGSIKSVIGSQHYQNNKHHHHSKNETSKGIDIALDSNTNILPSFGNKQDLKLIYLGTKWCGSGDNAKDLNDIGYFYLTDHCCREHDLCEETIEPNSEKFGLKNSGKFTRLHCKCDDKFYKCLKRVNTLVSKQIGIFYFNVLGHQCFKEDYPVLSCNSRMKGRCIEWRKNLTANKAYQWFDNRWF